MSRPKEFPEKIYVSFDSEGKLILVNLPENAITYMRQVGMRIQLYCVPEPFRKPRIKAEKDLPTFKDVTGILKPAKAPKSAQTPAVAPKEQDKQPQMQPKVLPETIGESAGGTVIHLRAEDKQDLADAEKSLSQSQQGNINLADFKEKLGIKSKRPRRTKKEMKQQMPGDYKSKDKPKWKCPDKECGWRGDNPPKATQGVNMGKLICPLCKLVIVKNE